MRRINLLGILLLAACSGQPESPEANLPVIAGEEQPASNAAPAEPPAPPQPSSANIVSEAPFSETSAQGAANVVQTYYALIEAGRYADAHKLWGSASDLADATFAEQFSRFREYHAEVLAPGDIEGAAGSLYVDVPVRTYGVTAKGEKFEEPAVVTLRRVNDVPGSTAEQRRWHIMKIDSPPKPH